MFALWLPGKKQRRTLLTHQSRQEGEDAGMAVGSNSIAVVLHVSGKVCNLNGGVFGTKILIVVGATGKKKNEAADMRHRRNMCNSPSSGGSQLTLASQWESRKVMTSPLAAEAPSRRVLMRPSLFLVLRIRTFGIRFMYSSSGTFRCSVDSTDRQIISTTRYKYSGFSPHLQSKTHTNDCKQSAFNSASLTYI